MTVHCLASIVHPCSPQAIFYWVQVVPSTGIVPVSTRSFTELIDDVSHSLAHAFESSINKVSRDQKRDLFVVRVT